MEQAAQLTGLGDEVNELQEDLGIMNALLRTQSELQDGAVDHFVQEWMKLRELAYDSEDCIDLYRLRIKIRPSGGVRTRFKHLLQTLHSRRLLQFQISSLRARAIAFSENYMRCGVNREALRRSYDLSATPMLTASTPAQALSLANDNAGHHLVVGMEDQVNTLASRLKVSAGANSYCKVFSVVGFEGVGKTRLAIEVCRLLEVDFPYQAFVSVSQAFEPSRDLKALLKRVHEQIVQTKAANNLDGSDLDQLAKQLEERLENKRYLIIIDDAWTIQAWEAIQSLLPENHCDSRIIVTTQIDKVAEACSPASVGEDLIYHMQPLKFEDSKRLFLSRVFGSTDATYPVELKGVMDNILKKCGGIPLAIISIANVFTGYKSSGNIDKWKSVCKSIGSQMKSNPTFEEIRQIVTLSFNHLPHELKGCMMYFSIFPEDYAIKKDRLLSKWIAEGFVSEKRGLTRIEVAESYFEELLSRNMIEEDHSDLLESDIQSYRVHDMLLEVMVSKSLEANFVSLLGGPYDGLSNDKIRRLSIHGSVNSTDLPPKRISAGHQGAEEVNLQHVRSLSMFHLKGHKFLNQLGNFTLLRVLDLQDCKGVTNKHVRYACQLHLLKFLSLKGTNISVVPPQVENLQHLQTLDVQKTLLDELPSTVTKLERLECLQITNQSGCNNYTLPRWLSRMKALRVLGTASLGNDAQVAREVGELEQLERLTLHIKTNRMEVLQQLALSLSKTYSLRILFIAADNQSDPKVLNFLYKLPAPPQLLRSLAIRGDIDGLPPWVGSLTYLADFYIRSTSLDVDQLLSVLCQLPNLKTLDVSLDENSNDKFVAARTSQKFPVLSYFAFSGARPNVIRFEEGSMEMLEQLVLRIGSRDFETRIIGMENLTNLKKVIITGSRDSLGTNHVLEQLKAWNDGLPKSLQFAVKIIE